MENSSKELVKVNIISSGDLCACAVSYRKVELHAHSSNSFVKCT